MMKFVNKIHILDNVKFLIKERLLMGYLGLNFEHQVKLCSWHFFYQSV